MIKLLSLLALVAVAAQAAPSKTIVPIENRVPLVPETMDDALIRFLNRGLGATCINGNMDKSNPGAPSRNYDARIILGEQATRGQFPHQAAIFIDDVHFCGGSLISDSWVLTAGHCVDGFGKWAVNLGAQTLSATEPGRIVQVTTTPVLHENYDPQNIICDIALIPLNEPVAFTEFIQTVKLPTQTQATQTFAGEAVIISGWGKVSDNSTSVSDELNYVQLTAILNEECSTWYGSTITGAIVCAAGPDGRSPCNGDSGGALVLVNTDGSYTEIGIASFVSDDGCASGAPSAYTRVPSFLDWISLKTGIVIEP